MTNDNPGGAVRIPNPDREPLDRLFAALCNPHRRRILTMLTVATPRDADSFKPALETPSEGWDRLTVELSHVHFPLLEAAGYIEWNRATETVRRGPDFAEIEPCLDLLTTHAAELPGEWP